MTAGSAGPVPDAVRREEIRANLAAVHARIAAACTAAGREAAAVTLVAVAKTFPATDVRLAAELGARDFGENRDQEARPKAAALADLELRWHFVGQLQRNKAAAVARYAAVVHSLDRVEVVDALARGAQRAGRTVCGLVQVNLDPLGGAGAGPAGRGGATPAEVPALAERIAAAPGLQLGGVMAVAPLGVDPAPAFAVLAGVAERVRVEHPAATIVSAGMSGDLEAAVAAGATHVRVGTAVFGSRPPMLLR